MLDDLSRPNGNNVQGVIGPNSTCSTGSFLVPVTAKCVVTAREAGGNLRLGVAAVVL